MGLSLGEGHFGRAGVVQLHEYFSTRVLEYKDIGHWSIRVFEYKGIGVHRQQNSRRKGTEKCQMCNRVVLQHSSIGVRILCVSAIGRTTDYSLQI